jgi:hypothetical protein
LWCSYFASFIPFLKIKILNFIQTGWNNGRGRGDIRIHTIPTSTPLIVPKTTNSASDIRITNPDIRKFNPDPDTWHPDPNIRKVIPDLDIWKGHPDLDMRKVAEGNILDPRLRAKLRAEVCLHVFIYVYTYLRTNIQIHMYIHKNKYIYV